MIEDNAVYVFAHKEDMVVPPWMTKNVEKYYEKNRAKVRYEEKPGKLHEFDKATAPTTIA